MNLKQILCGLLSVVCNSVTSVETSLGGGPASGPEKKAEAMKGVAGYLDSLVNQGIHVVRADLEKAAGVLIDHVVTAAHAIGAFVHKPAAEPEAAAAPSEPPAPAAGSGATPQA